MEIYGVFLRFTITSRKQARCFQSFLDSGLDMMIMMVTRTGLRAHIIVLFVALIHLTASLMIGCSCFYSSLVRFVALICSQYYYYIYIMCVCTYIYIYT